jgi:hypothetical protein
VSAAAIAIWLLTGVSFGDVLLFAGHELLFVLAPGCLAYLALSHGRPGALKLGAVGYALGSVLEILAFALTAALHARPALWAYPPVVIGAALLVLHRRGRSLSRPSAPMGGPVSWALAALSLAALGYIVVAYFLFNPLPGQAGSVVYVSDLVFHLGVAAEALHHWPISDPKVAGVALPYEDFVYFKLAAVSQLTGISLPTVLFRLYIVPLILDIVALLACAGRGIGGRRAVGLLAAGLFVFVGSMGLDSHDVLMFANTAFFSLYASPSYVFGLVVFLAVLIVLHEQLSGFHGPSGWVLLTLLLIGCSAAKATILPVLLGGLALYLVGDRIVAWWHARGTPVRSVLLGFDRAAAVALLLAIGVFLVTFWLIYAGESGGLRVHPPGTVRSMVVIQYAESRLSATGSPLFWVLASVVGVVGFCGATLAGIPAALAGGELRRARSTTLLIALLIASFGPFLFLSHKGGSQNFFTYYGLAAASVLSAQGLVWLWDRARPVPARTLILAALGWLGVLLAAAILPYGLLSSPSAGPLYALWLGLPLLVVACLLVLAWRRRPWRPALLLMAAGAVVLVGVLQTPLTTTHDLISALRVRSTPYPRDSPIGEGLTPDLQRALAWIRGHTPTSAVIAVNNQYSDSVRHAPTYYYYSAFGERRVFIEGWENTIPAANLTDPAITPFPYRLALNNAVFYNADPRALAVMTHRFGVSYLLVDRAHGPVQPRLAALGRVVYANPGAIVYRVASPGAT